MAKLIDMPKLSDTMKEGVIARWLAKENDKVQAGRPVVEIETDKATMEFESPASGVLLKILVADGASCALGAPIGVVGKPGEDWQEVLQKRAKPPPSPTPQAKATPVAAVAPGAPFVPQTGRPKASPLARKLAEIHNIALSAVQGTGPGGRIVKRDLGSPQESEPVKAVGRGDTSHPHTNMRRTIARRLTESVQQSPHFYTRATLDMDALVAWRKEVLQRRPEVKFSLNDLVIFFVSRALLRHPFLNATFAEDAIVTYGDVNMSVAVALPQGLITPTLTGAHLLPLDEIATRVRGLVVRAKEGKLTPQETQGGTFTISNLGMAGVEEFTAIINPPQSAILAVGACSLVPVVLGTGSLGAGHRMRVTLSCDHRVIDGALAAEFLATLQASMRDPLGALCFSS